MNILTTQYTLSKKSFDIYVAGCKAPHCPGCHNPEGWDFNKGTEFNQNYANFLTCKVRDAYDMIDNFMIFGGEPLDQNPFELINMISCLKTMKDVPVWLFTRYGIEEVPKMFKLLCDYIKCGTYDEDKLSNDNIQYNMKLASTNQHIYKKGMDY